MDLQTLAEDDEIVVIVGFFDLMGFTEWTEDRPPRDVLEFASALFNRTGQVIDDAGGVLIKAMGDAGLFIFPADDPDKAVLALHEMKRGCDAWLSDRGYPDEMSIKIQLGPVACGRVGPPQGERLDVYGMTVNRTARMKGRCFTIGSSLFDRLKSETQQGLTKFNDDEFVASD